MKLGPRELTGFFQAPHKQSRGVLLYGPDNGLIRERSKLITEAVIGKNADPLNRTELVGDKIKSDPALLQDELCSISLLGGNRIVILREANEKIEPIIKSVFESIKNNNYLIVEGDDLTTSSALRKLFESSGFLAAIPCYLPDSRDLQGYIREYAAALGLHIQQDALVYFSENLGNDRLITKNELDKIALYLGEEKQVSLATAMLLTRGNSNDSTEDLCHAIALGKKKEADRLLEILLAEGTQAVAILRSLLRYFQRLDLAFGYVSKGESKDSAIKMLRPPVFFKAVESVKQSMARLTPASVSVILSLLLKAEKQAKSGIINMEMVIKNVIIQL